jgi:transposase
MLQITPQMKILVAVEPADFRKGIDGLVRLCKDSLQEDPFAGAVFVFRNRRGTAIKVLVYDGQGFWLCHKRLSEGRFRWWPSAPAQNAEGHDAEASVPGQVCQGESPGGSSTVGAVFSRRSGPHVRGTGLASGRSSQLMVKTALDFQREFMPHACQMDRTCGKESRANHDAEKAGDHRSEFSTV